MNSLVAIDQSQSKNQNRGMARYTRTLIRWLERMDGVDVVGLPPAGSRISSRGQMTYFTPFWEQVVLPGLLRKLKPDVAIYPYNTGPLIRYGGMTEIVVVYDLAFLEPEDRFSGSSTLRHRLGRHYRSVIVPRIVRGSLHVLTVSMFSKRAICSRLAIDESRVSVIPCAIEDALISRSSVNKRNNAKYIIHVGGDTPRKNVRGTIKMYSMLPDRVREQYQLVIFGVRSHSVIMQLNDLVRQSGLESRVMLMPFVSDEELFRYYDDAVISVFPSYTEGFGIPVIESMARGVPVVCSNRGPLPEIAGDAAVYFDPSNIPEFAEAVFSVLADEALRHRLALSASSRSKSYSESLLSNAFQDYLRGITQRSS